ncbi:MAG TPA: GNAT family N-acetyltransferase [Ktedonobacterales bacterium]|nr:GNAT family N-acetyltransferase [Ktedonobacterales bacterium]
MGSRQRWGIAHGALWAMERGSSLPPLALPRIPATFNEVDPVNAEVLARAMNLPDVALILSRFDAGRRCMAAWVDGTLAAYGWISQGVECIGELEQSLHLPAGEAYIWDCATVESYRNCHLYRALLSHITHIAWREGMQRLWIAAMAENIPSIRGLAAAGFRPVVLLTYARFLGLRYHRVVGYSTTSPDLIVAARWRLSALHKSPASWS